MIVTTSLRTTKELLNKAKAIAEEQQATFLYREHQALTSIEREEDLLIVEKKRLVAFPKGAATPFFFHPNSAMFRVKRLARGEKDPLIEASQLESGMSFLDCTLGLGSDSIVASAIVTDSGSVTGVEENKLIAYIVKQGIQSWTTTNSFITDAMQRVHVVHAQHEKYLAELGTNSVDVVYFDPMFEIQLISDGIAPLKQIAQQKDLTSHAIEEAKRVARKRVVLKDHFRSKRFEAFDFHVLKRPTAKFHFGFIEV